eukprot:gene6158-6783_t
MHWHNLLLILLLAVILFASSETAIPTGDDADVVNEENFSSQIEGEEVVLVDPNSTPKDEPPEIEEVVEVPGGEAGRDEKKKSSASGSLSEGRRKEEVLPAQGPSSRPRPQFPTRQGVTTTTSTTNNGQTGPKVDRVAVNTAQRLQSSSGEGAKLANQGPAHSPSYTSPTRNQIKSPEQRQRQYEAEQKANQGPAQSPGPNYPSRNSPARVEEEKVKAKIENQPEEKSVNYIEVQNKVNQGPAQAPVLLFPSHHEQGSSSQSDDDDAMAAKSDVVVVESSTDNTIGIENEELTQQKTDEVIPLESEEEKKKQEEEEQTEDTPIKTEESVKVEPEEQPSHSNSIDDVVKQESTTLPSTQESTEDQLKPTLPETGQDSPKPTLPETSQDGPKPTLPETGEDHIHLKPTRSEAIEGSKKKSWVARSETMTPTSAPLPKQSPFKRAFRVLSLPVTLPLKVISNTIGFLFKGIAGFFDAILRLVRIRK